MLAWRIGALRDDPKGRHEPAVVMFAPTCPEEVVSASVPGPTRAPLAKCPKPISGFSEISSNRSMRRESMGTSVRFSGMRFNAQSSTSSGVITGTFSSREKGKLRLARAQDQSATPECKNCSENFMKDQLKHSVMQTKGNGFGMSDRRKIMGCTQERTSTALYSRRSPPLLQPAALAWKTPNQSASPQVTFPGPDQDGSKPELTQAKRRCPHC